MKVWCVCVCLGVGGSLVAVDADNAGNVPTECATKKQQKSSNDNAAFREFACPIVS